MLRQRRHLPLPVRPESPSDRGAAVAYLGITHSHPDWLVARWLERYGFDAAEAWVRFNNETPPLTIRANRLRMTRDQLRATLAGHGVETEPTRYAPDGLVVVEGNPLHTETNDGSFFVQEEASQLVSIVVGAQAGERVLDLCASPGGKTTAMAADMNDTGLVVASDVRSRRLQLLRDTVESSGARHVHVVHVPAAGPLPFRVPFDRVLVDAPCSGLGTVRRDPDIRWRRAESDLEPFARAQLTMIRNAASAVRAGGRLIYSTCSSEPEENERVVSSFLSDNSNFGLVDLRADRPVYFDALEPVLDEDGVLRTSPHEHGLEAFYGAVLRRVK
jgi:16S rRNA (cytosine967-C5)-methyltransferase